MKTITLPIEKLSLSVRQILLTLRHGETEDIRWWFIIGLLATVERASGLERLSFREEIQIGGMVFDLISNHTLDSGEILVRHEHLWIEEYARMCDANGEFLLNDNQWLISHLLLYAARKKKQFRGIKAIFCVYSPHALVHKQIVYYPATVYSEIEKFVHEKLSLVQKYFDIPDEQLPPCTKENGVFCIDCLVAKHCSQRGSL